MRSILVLDTCGVTGYVALLDADTALAPITDQTIPSRQTQEEILPAIQHCLAAASLSPTDLASIAVVTGPGSFTGVRVGLAVAKGLALAASLPLIPISALAVLAHAAPPATLVTAWLDAGRTDIYTGHYRTQSPLPPALTEPEAMLPRTVALASAQASILTTDPALANLLPNTRLLTPQELQQATREAALALYQAGAFTDIALADSNYLRVPDAETALRTRQAQQNQA